jgi:hypothetical protein
MVWMVGLTIVDHWRMITRRFNRRNKRSAKRPN